MRGRREGSSEVAQPAEVGRVERPGPPDVRVVRPHRRQQPTACDQAHARSGGRRPYPDAAPHPECRISAQQKGKRLGQRDELRRDKALTYAVGATWEDQLHLGASGNGVTWAFAPGGEHSAAGNLVWYEEQLAIQHATARYRLGGTARRYFPACPIRP